MKFFCIADEDTVRGFRLAGVAGTAVSTPAEAAEALAKAIQEPEWGILILSSSIASRIRASVESVRLERERPLFVEIPGPEGPAPGGESLRRLVQRSVGVSLGPEGRL